MQLTSADDCFPLVELALVRHCVEVTALEVSEGGQLMETRCSVTDLVPPSLSQTIPPSVFRTVGRLNIFGYFSTDISDIWNNYLSNLPAYLTCHNNCRSSSHCIRSKGCLVCRNQRINTENGKLAVKSTINLELCWCLSSDCSVIVVWCMYVNIKLVLSVILFDWKRYLFEPLS